MAPLSIIWTAGQSGLRVKRGALGKNLAESGARYWDPEEEDESGSEDRFKQARRNTEDLRILHDDIRANVAAVTASPTTHSLWVSSWRG